MATKYLSTLLAKAAAPSGANVAMDEIRLTAKLRSGRALVHSQFKAPAIACAFCKSSSVFSISSSTSPWAPQKYYEAASFGTYCAASSFRCSLPLASCRPHSFSRSLMYTRWWM